MSQSVTLEANRPKNVTIDGRYLYVISAAGAFKASAKGIGEIRFDAGGHAEIPPNVHSLTFRDTSGEVNHIEIESTDIKKRGSGENVHVSNAVVVQEILKPIEVSVTTQAEFAAGSEFGLVSNGAFVALDDVPVLSGSGGQIVAANSNRKVLFVSISAPVDSTNLNECRLGGASVSASKGVQQFCGNGVVATMTLEMNGPLHLFNAGQDTVSVSISELVK